MRCFIWKNRQRPEKGEDITMPATRFICPNGGRILIAECLKGCPEQERCMFLPTLRAISKTLNRNLKEPSVTELISGVRETYLKKVTDYAVDPQGLLYALQGQAIHSLNEHCTEGDILSEVRLKDHITSGQFDLYGKIMDEAEGVLGDLKVTSSYKLMKALGIYKVSVPTREVYKTGLRKGQPKYRNELRDDGVKHVFEWALQLNYYRMLLEKVGFEVKRIYIQAVCRDNNLRIASERGIQQTVYILPIKRISDRWLKCYFGHKAKLLAKAMQRRKLPPVCSARERWNDRKCLAYCDAGEHCPYGQQRRVENEQKAV